MELPKFLLADNTDYADSIFILHTEFPRFIINLVDDEVEWLEDLRDTEEDELQNEVIGLIQQAEEFYDREMKRYEE
ncbi:hypothetical protein [Urechidicola croceus]|uniref:Uncharacterized protein n=1 Tax=Urechidicola croceus TaxID=1850246 RepID=A0A1D8P5U0_9FLAO|nr:hypothetical protein [Urechidicola croceus]AOW19940.1 hypothetical protein LPB138_04240 [Urechidicola croceus]